MTKFYQWINEGYGKSRIEDITESDAKESIRFNCKKSIDNTFIYRGGSNNVEFGFGDSSNTKEIRVSKNTKNYYTLIFDNSKEWSSFPPRSKSFICSTSKNIARFYGDVYHRVIPFDGVEIGICPDNDIWMSFSFLYSLEGFTLSIEQLAEKYQLNKMKMESDYKYLMKSIDEIGKNIRKEPYDIEIIPEDDMREFFEDWLKTNKKLSRYVLEKFSPKENGFKLKKAGNELPTKNEVWFSGKSIFIRSDKESEILNAYGSILDWANDIENGNKGTMVT